MLGLLLMHCVHHYEASRTAVNVMCRKGNTPCHASWISLMLSETAEGLIVVKWFLSGLGVAPLVSEGLDHSGSSCLEGARFGVNRCAVKSDTHADRQTDKEREKERENKTLMCLTLVFLHPFWWLLVWDKAAAESCEAKLARNCKTSTNPTRLFRPTVHILWANYEYPFRARL